MCECVCLSQRAHKKAPISVGEYELHVTAHASLEDRRIEPALLSIMSSSQTIPLENISLQLRKVNNLLITANQGFYTLCKGDG